MYAPLKYVEQVEHYFRVPMVSDDVCNRLNEMSCEAFSSMFEDETLCHLMLYYYSSEVDRMYATGKFTDRIKESMSIIKRLYYSRFNESVKSLGYGACIEESDLDWFNLCMSSYIVNDWKYHKYTYKVSKTLGEELVAMESPKAIYTSLLKRTPCKVFYIDCSEFGNLIVDNLEGMFICLDQVVQPDGTIMDLYSMCCTLLIRGEDGTCMPIYYKGTITTSVDLDENTPIDVEFAVDSDKSEYREILMEDGTVRKIRSSDISSFVFNFLIYLQAINKDVEEYSVSQKAFKTAIDRKVKPKNKFKEVRQYNVGYKISSNVNKKHVKSKKELSSNDRKGTPKSAHFRSAHWHHYWVGSRDNKELIVKWLQGMYIGGKSESGTAVVHRVDK